MNDNKKLKVGHYKSISDMFADLWHKMCIKCRGCGEDKCLYEARVDFDTYYVLFVRCTECGEQVETYRKYKDEVNADG